jgi:excisionase family DNA binding protein
MPADFPSSGFLLLSEAAQYARVSPRTVRRWIAQGLPFHQVKAGSRVLIKSTDLERFLTRYETSQPKLDCLIDEIARSLQSTSI